MVYVINLETQERVVEPTVSMHWASHRAMTFSEQYPGVPFGYCFDDATDWHVLFLDGGHYTRREIKRLAQLAGLVEADTP